ncbi:bifunctional uridylate/adenylate kinase [Komagataella kurtzmanii]|nr:bifunctional uridylate/adenylate kinase [Komagataella kurtzmanii]
MFTRSVRSSFVRAGPIRLGPVVPKRLYSQAQNGGINHKRILIGLGLLAIGTTLYGTTNPTKTPIAFVEPATERAFKDGEVSVIFVLGGPGAGKGTQCAKLVSNYGFVHLSAGDLLRAEQKREGSKYGEMISQYIRDGLIVPQEVTIALLEQAMKENFEKGKTRFLIDGFPRKMDQAKTFEEKVAKSKVTLFFDCPESVLLERLLKRGQTSGREDDNAESIKKRFKTFVETSMPVVDYFGKQGRVLKVSCDHPVDQVYSQVVSVLKEKGIFADNETENK